jgi:acetyltransferase-like isoleucine patch superfamily enzyme
MIVRNIFKIAFDAWTIKRDPIKFARKQGVQIGKQCRLLNIHSKTFGSEPYLIKIGDHVTVTSGVRFINHDGGMWVFREHEPDIELFGTIEIGNNVFIGMDTLILPGVKIGDNCVIGAGSIVTRSIEANSVAVGAPAKPIKTISEYRQSVEEKVAFVRNLIPEAKRKWLEKKYAVHTGGHRDDY